MNEKNKRRVQSLRRMRMEIIQLALELLHVEETERRGPGTAPASVREMPRLRAVNE